MKRLSAHQMGDSVRAIIFWNSSGCAVLLLMTESGAQAITRGEFSSKLHQMVGRGLWEILPKTPSGSDVAAIWQNYGLPDHDHETSLMVAAMVRATCFGKLTMLLRLARAAATRDGMPLSWDAFRDALNRMGRSSE